MTVAFYRGVVAAAVDAVLNGSAGDFDGRVFDGRTGVMSARDHVPDGRTGSNRDRYVFDNVFAAAVAVSAAVDVAGGRIFQRNYRLLDRQHAVVGPAARVEMLHHGSGGRVEFDPVDRQRVFAGRKVGAFVFDEAAEHHVATAEVGVCRIHDHFMDRDAHVPGAAEAAGHDQLVSDPRIRQVRRQRAGDVVHPGAVLRIGADVEHRDIRIGHIDRAVAAQAAAADSVEDVGNRRIGNRHVHAAGHVVSVAVAAAVDVVHCRAVFDLQLRIAHRRRQGAAPVNLVDLHIRPRNRQGRVFDIAAQAACIRRGHIRVAGDRHVARGRRRAVHAAAVDAPHRAAGDHHIGRAHRRTHAIRAAEHLADFTAGHVHIGRAGRRTRESAVQRLERLPAAVDRRNARILHVDVRGSHPARQRASEHTIPNRRILHIEPGFRICVRSLRGGSVERVVRSEVHHRVVPGAERRTVRRRHKLFRRSRRIRAKEIGRPVHRHLHRHVRRNRHRVRNRRINGHGTFASIRNRDGSDPLRQVVDHNRTAVIGGQG